MVKLLTITWDYSDNFEIKDTFLYKSFIKNNPDTDLIHIHYNRNNYIQLEEEFKSRFDFQYDYLLYKLYLTKDKINNIDASHIIFCDANDVVCLDNIQNMPKVNHTLFSSESNQYPWSMGDWGGLEYSFEERNSKRFLNAGLFIANKQNYIQLLDSIISNVLTTNLKSLGGDQGAFIFHYLSKFEPKIVLDKENKYFLSTYTLDHNNFLDVKLPMFIHDNGWDYGSPRFIEKFNLA